MYILIVDTQSREVNPYYSRDAMQREPEIITVTRKVPHIFESDTSPEVLAKLVKELTANGELPFRLFKNCEEVFAKLVTKTTLEIVPLASPDNR